VLDIDAIDCTSHPYTPWGLILGLHRFHWTRVSVRPERRWARRIRRASADRRARQLGGQPASGGSFV